MKASTVKPASYVLPVSAPTRCANWSKAFGYLGDTHQLDPSTAPLVKQAYADILAGASLADICRQWNTAGALTATGKLWDAATMSRFLRRPRNCGLRGYKGEIVGKGTWPPLVDESVWRAAQAVLDAPGRAPGRKAVRRHLLTSVALCGKCGHTLAGSYRTDGRIVYVCKQCRGRRGQLALVRTMMEKGGA